MTFLSATVPKHIHNFLALAVSHVTLLNKQETLDFHKAEQIHPKSSTTKVQVNKNKLDEPFLEDQYQGSSWKSF